MNEDFITLLMLVAEAMYEEAETPMGHAGGIIPDEMAERHRRAFEAFEERVRGQIEDPAPIYDKVREMAHSDWRMM